MKITAGVLHEWLDGKRWITIDPDYEHHNNYIDFEVRHTLYICAINEDNQDFTFEDRVLKSREIKLNLTSESSERWHNISFKDIVFGYREKTEEIFLINKIISI